jgi:uncharacterized protein (DUF4415 family)
MNGKSTISTAPDLARDDAPRLTREIAERAQLAVGNRIIREARPRGRPRKAAGERKEAVSLRLSPAVLAYFRSTGEGWQTRIDAALQAFVRESEGEYGTRSGNRARSAETVHEGRKPFRAADNGSAKPRPAPG